MSVARVAPPDAALASLAEALDEDRMARELGALLRPWYYVRSCEVTRVKYRPGRSAVIGYRLSVDDVRTGAVRDQLVCGGLYPTGQAWERHRKACAIARTEGGMLRPVSLIEELGMVVWAFPNDRKLDGLPVLADVSRLRDELLAELVRERWGERWRIAGLADRVVSYFPEHACTVRVDLTLADWVEGTIRSWGVFGKTRYDAAGRDTFAIMRDLWDSDAHRRGDVALARPLAYQSRHRVLWQEAVAGSTLDRYLDDSALGPRLGDRVGRALAAFHGSGVAAPRTVTVASILDGLEETARVVGLVLPRGHARVSGVVARLRERAATLDRTVRATLHGDLHSKNIMIDGEQVILIDLDRVSGGPPLAELGSLIAEIRYRAARSSRTPDGGGALAEALVRSYRQHAAWPVRSAELDWYTAAALIGERVHRCLTSLKPGRTDIVDDLIGLAEDLSLRLGAAC